MVLNCISILISTSALILILVLILISIRFPILMLILKQLTHPPLYNITASLLSRFKSVNKVQIQ